MELSALLPLLPTQGEVAIVGLDPRGGPASTAWVEADVSDERFEADLAGAVDLFSGEGRGVYFTPFSFEFAPGTRRQRYASNAVAARALFVDLDCHGGAGQYPTVLAARRALRMFERDSGLPATLVVATGRGLQAYWAADADMSPAEWKAASESLWSLALAAGLKLDMALFQDRARVMRVPGTLNHAAGVLATVEREGSVYPKKALIAKLKRRVRETMPAPVPVKAAMTTGAPIKSDILDHPFNRERLELMLEALPSQFTEEQGGYARWRDVLWAIKRTGLSNAWEAACAWARRASAQYDDLEHALEATWASDREDVKGVGPGTLIWAAREFAKSKRAARDMHKNGRFLDYGEICERLGIAIEDEVADELAEGESWTAAPIVPEIMIPDIDRPKKRIRQGQPGWRPMLSTQAPEAIRAPVRGEPGWRPVRRVKPAETPRVPRRGEPGWRPVRRANVALSELPRAPIRGEPGWRPTRRVAPVGAPESPLEAVTLCSPLAEEAEARAAPPDPGTHASMLLAQPDVDPALVAAILEQRPDRIGGATGDLPKGFIRGEDGGLCRVSPDKKGGGDVVPVARSCPEYVCGAFFKRDDGSGEYVHQFLVQAPATDKDQRQAVVAIPETAFDDGRLLAKKLVGEGGLSRSSGDIGPLVEYMRGVTIMARQRFGQALQTDRLGWFETRGEASFQLGGERLTAKGAVSAPLTDRARKTADSLRVGTIKGTLEGQVAVLDLFGVPGAERHAMVVLRALGSPLFRLLNNEDAGAVSYVFSKVTGNGKSTALRMGAGMYGGDMWSGSSTDNAMAGALQVLSDLPLSVDEIKGSDIDKLRDMILMQTSGKQKSRLNADMNVTAPVGRWYAPLMLSANVPPEQIIVAGQSAEATLARFCAIEITYPQDTSPWSHLKDDVYVSQRVGEHAGHIGRKFLAWVVRNYAAVKDDLRALLGAIRRVPGYKDASHRFQAPFAVVSIFAMRWLRAQGFIASWDTARMETVIVEQMFANDEAIRSVACTASASAVFDKTVADLATRTVIMREGKPPGLPRNGVEKGRVALRIEPEKKRAFIDQEPLLALCARFGVSLSDVRKEVQERYGWAMVQTEERDLAIGLPLETAGRSKCRTLCVPIEAVTSDPQYLP